MNGIDLTAFEDELVKIAFLGDIWRRFTDLFRSEGEKTKRRVAYFFSPKAGEDKWDKFTRNVRSEDFVHQVQNHPLADDTLKAHAESMHHLSRGKPVGKVKSERLPGKTYEVREVPDGLACTCPDWRFVGTITPGYECKHIKAFKQGKDKVAYPQLIPLLLRAEYYKQKRRRRGNVQGAEHKLPRRALQDR